MPVAGAPSITGVQPILSLLRPLSPGAERLCWAEPLGLIVPLLLSFAVGQLRHGLRASEATAPGRILRRLVRATIVR